MAHVTQMRNKKYLNYCLVYCYSETMIDSSFVKAASQLSDSSNASTAEKCLGQNKSPPSTRLVDPGAQISGNHSAP
jgi:hypothetical protein